jgi:outer membrane protein assembly factor BamB
MPKVLLLHENPVGVTRFPRGPEVLHRFAGCNLRLVLYGHVQANVVSVYNGIPHVTVTGDDLAHDSSPLSYLLVHCDGDRARCRILPHLAGGDQSTPPLRAPMPGAPRLTWSARVGAGMSVGAPAPHGARLLVGLRSTGGLDECAIVAVEAATGDVAWRQPVDGSVEGGLLVRDDAAYCGTQSGSVYCLDAHTGAVRWQWNNREHLPFAGCPIWDEGRLHLGANWEMYALDAATGRALWRTLATRAGVSYFAPGHAAALVLGERVFHNRHFNARAKTLLQSVDKVTGRDFQAGPPNDFHPQWRHATPVEWNDRILHVADGLYLLDPARLEAPVWYVPHGPGSAAPALAGAVAHVSYHDEIVAHDLIHDGAILWRVPHESSLAHFNGNPWSKYGRGQPLGAFAAPLVVGDALLVTDTGGRCRCLRRQDGAELWRLGVHAPLLAPPLVWGARLLLADYAGQLHAYEWPNP